MKKILLVTIALVFISSLSFADAFAPSVLKIVAEDEILYDFDGSNLTIGFTLEQKPANMYLVITTKGKAADIVGVQNGYLGWHYVNKIDTTVYVSGKNTKALGQNTIVWDGKDQDGEKVVPDEYYYYLWGADNISAREWACSFMGPSCGWGSRTAYFIDHDVNDMPLDQPFIFANWIWWTYVYARNNVDTHPTVVDHQYGSVFKWNLGGDPFDVTLMETTFIAGFEEMWAEAKVNAGRNPTDETTFFAAIDDIPNQVSTVQKYTWVEGGSAEIVDDWGGWDNFTWENTVLAGAWSITTPCFTDNHFIYVRCNEGMHCISFDGEEVFDKSLYPKEFFWDPFEEREEEGNWIPFRMDYSDNVANKWVTGGGCIWEAFNWTRLHDDMEDLQDFLIWRNANGDYYLDSHDPESETPWACGGTIINGVKAYGAFSYSQDKYDFTWDSLSLEGNIGDFAVHCPDGTGIGEIFSYSDRLSSMMLQHGTQYITCGSPYDGLYTEGIPPVDTASADQFSFSNWLGADTFRGVITNESGTAVEEEGAAAFAVAQNAPNPFNPTTTINFTIPEAGQVSIDVFNVAGQKVGTLVNDAMSAGTHSIVWDASGFSAGVYFYTVKSGDFSRTMKMTLLK